MSSADYLRMRASAADSSPHVVQPYKSPEDNNGLATATFALG